MSGQQDFFSRPKVRRALWAALYGSCAATLIAGLLFKTKAPFGFASFFGFYAILGFVSCAVLILLAFVLGKFLKKPGDYYDQ